MPLTQLNGLQILKMENIEYSGIHPMFFSRHGGVSSAPWATLNLGGTVGDDPQNVRENRTRVFNAICRKETDAFDVWQVHSDTIIYTNQPRRGNELQQADAIITDEPGLILFMRFADCVPIMIMDPIRGIISIIHSGWPGTVKRIAEKTARKLITQYHCNPADLRAVIGPSICVNHYPVGQDVIDEVESGLPEISRQVLTKRKEQTYFDLWKANEYLLRETGIEQIELSGICTAENPLDWFSHRGEHGKTGRFGAVIYMD